MQNEYLSGLYQLIRNYLTHAKIGNKISKF